jgi:4-amino-4-deoxy-L-arabinose transferase-like glycosyltransferase
MSTRKISAAIFVGVLLLHALLLPRQGLTDDDDFYAPAGIQYVAWLGELVTHPGEALTRAHIDAAFSPNHEHPPLAKIVMGVASALTSSFLPIYGALDGARFGTAFLAALTAAALFALCAGTLGVGQALVAVALLLSLPRFFFHSEVATLDVPVSAFVLFTTCAFFWGEASTRWAYAAGVVFGLALLTKLNAPFAAIPATLYTLAQRWRSVRIVEGHALALPPLPRSLVAMAVLGPVLFVALWPWLWFDTASRFAAYVAFHMNHYPILLFYQGEVWSKPSAPWHMPFVMAAGTMPLPIVVLGLLGVLRAACALVRIVRTEEQKQDAADKLLALVLLEAAFAIGIVAFTDVPKYGGEKLFMPFFPLWCVLAAAGVPSVVEGACALFPRIRAKPAVVVIGLVAALPGFVATARFSPGFALSYYGEALGGLRGAVAAGYERTYYDVADKELARWLDAHAQGRVHFEPNHKEYARTYRWLRRDGVVRKDLALDDDAKRADVLVLTHERRWSTYPTLLQEARKRELLYEKRIDGVPLYSVYARGP